MPPRYAELRCKTNFSFLTGASHGEELVLRARALDYAALAITDLNTLAGIVRAHVAAKAAGLKLLIGAEITPDDAPPVLLYAPDKGAYGRLSRLITRGRARRRRGNAGCHSRTSRNTPRGYWRRWRPISRLRLAPTHRGKGPAPSHGERALNVNRKWWGDIATSSPTAATSPPRCTADPTTRSRSRAW